MIKADATILFILALFLGLPGISMIQSGNQNMIVRKSDFLHKRNVNMIQQEKSKYIYAGSEKCASVCHNNNEMGFQYDIIRGSQLAKAYEVLASDKAVRFAKKAHLTGNPQESQVCLKCHVTGGGLDSSFFAATYRKDDGITCEACHKGPYIPKSFLPKETDCLKCHNNSVHRIPKFDFRKRCEIIAHPRPDSKHAKV